MKLIDLIIREFSGVLRPPARQIADRGSTPVTLEALAIEEYFAPLRWQDVSWESLRDYHGDKAACLYFMSPNAFLYFFPSYLLMTLNDNCMETGLIGQIMPLTYGLETDSRFFNLMQRCYNTRQKKCIGYFLLQINERYFRSCMLGPDGKPYLEPDELSPEEIAFRFWLGELNAES